MSREKRALCPPCAMVHTVTAGSMRSRACTTPISFVFSCRVALFVGLIKREAWLRYSSRLGYLSEPSRAPFSMSVSGFCTSRVETTWRHLPPPMLISLSPYRSAFSSPAQLCATQAVIMAPSSSFDYYYQTLGELVSPHTVPQHRGAVQDSADHVQPLVVCRERPVLLA